MLVETQYLPTVFSKKVIVYKIARKIWSGSAPDVGTIKQNLQMVSKNFDTNLDNLTLRHRVYRCFTRNLFIMALIALFSAGLCLVILSS